MEAKPCRVKTCPAMSKVTSVFDYCPIHDSIATNPELFDLALKGRLTGSMKEFAEEVERGYYPKKIW